MQSWNLKTLQTAAQQPKILSSGEDARVIFLHLGAGEEMQEHEVHEWARLIPIEGEVALTTPDGETVAASAGHLFEFGPGERHTLTAATEARLLLILTPWPGEGHPGAMTIEQKADVRQRAAQHDR